LSSILIPKIFNSRRYFFDKELMRLVKSVENEIALAEKKFNESKQKLITIRDQFIQEIEKVLPTFLSEKIKEVVAEHHKIIMSMPEETLRKLKRELQQAIPVNVEKTIRDLKASTEWFDCKEAHVIQSISYDAKIWETITFTATPLTKILEEYGIYVPIEQGLWGYRHLTPINLLILGKPVKDLDSVLVSAKSEYCDSKFKYDALVEKHKQQIVKKKWETL